MQDYLYIIMIVVIIKLALEIGIIVSIFNISSKSTKQDKGQDIIIDKLETLEYQCANINNNLSAILEEVRNIDDDVSGQYNDYNGYEE